MAPEVCDVLIIGAGTAGCVLANRLSADPDTRVIVAEAGRSDRDLLLHVPGASIRNSTTPKFNWGFVTEPEAALDNRQLFWAQGKVLGGSSAINGMIYARGHPLDYDRWVQLGCAGWGYDDLLPFFRRAERNERGAGPLHGGDGPVQVSRGRPDLAICQRFLNAAAEEGFPVLDDLNTPAPEGFGHYDTTVGRGRRSSSASAYLNPVRGRPNLRVWLHSLAARLIIEGSRVVGAELIREGRRVTVRAEREVLLCGGAVNSPQLLMLSGIGPADHLDAMGIPVRVDLPAVGENLQNHVSYRMQFAVSEPITAYKYVRPAGALRAGAEYLLRRRGVLSQSIVPTGGFFRTDPSLDAPDVQVQLGVGLIGRVGGSVLARLPREHGFSLGVNQGSPYSRGTVRLRSADPTVPPAIAPRYFSNPRDLDVLVLGVERMRALARRPSLARVISREIDPSPDIADRAALRASARTRAGTAFHPVGTCRMGADAESVVDLQLRVRGVEGLRVADASVIPALMNANTNAAALMIGERAAALALEG
ncbi:GMC family oxidoreductase [Roseomonas sp. BN140053]|uniref:GMC family oxidoreductase n=1 Tax=Roseomonas sp. BN140053 TaxID=3391898 RepID=UPI0039E9381F